MIASSRSEPAAQHHAQDAQPQRHLVGDQLGAAPQAAQEAVLVVAGPAAQDHAVDGDAAQGEDVDHAHVDAAARRPGRSAADAPAMPRLGRQHAAEGNHGEDRQRRDENRRSGPAMNRTLSTWAGRVFRLEDELHAVGQRLAQAEQADLRQRNAHAVRAPAGPAPRRRSTAPAAPGRRPPSSARRSAGRS